MSAFYKKGIAIAVLLRVNQTDHTGEFDPFFTLRLRQAYECMFNDSIGESLSDDLRQASAT